ncbi:MAG: ABC transporter ATP-binding protein [Alphaproteobacteria bacterium]
MPALRLDGVRVRYGSNLGTDGVSFELGVGETMAIVGANGAGKSSTLKAILGMVDYPEGDILLDGKSLKGLKPFEVIRLGVGYSPEGRRVFPALSVRENLKIGAYSRPASEVHESLDRIFTYFPRLRERASQRAGSLSGGEQQMLAIGRALMSRPAIFLLDEPSLGLAPVIVERIGEILLEIQKAEHLSIVLAEQNAVWAFSVAQRAVILELGKVALAGAAAELMEQPQVRRAYLGI